jgi:hypothetical protein
VEEFPLSGARELLFGRDPLCDIRFDKDRDEFVSRRHMKLVVDDSKQLEFRAEDLGALNGTFVNRRRVTGSVKLQAGDVVQLGAGGPEFTFDVIPDNLTVTPLSGFAAADDPPGISAGRPPRGAGTLPANALRALEFAPGVRQVPAKAVARPPGETRAKLPQHSPLNRRFASIAFVCALVAGCVSFARLSPVPRLDGIKGKTRAFLASAHRLFGSFETLKPEEIARQSAEALVTVESAWRLVDSATGRPLKQIYIPNRREPSDGAPPPLIPDAGPKLPVFVLLPGNRLEPVLTVADQGSNREIGGKSRSDGFVIASDHLILTSRNATSPWRMPYEWPASDMAGIVAVFDEQLKLSNTAVIARRQFPRWVPMDTDFVVENGLDQTVRVNRRIRGKGLLDSSAVQNAVWRFDLPVGPVKESDETGIAAIRLDAEMAKHGAVIANDVPLAAGQEWVIVGAASGRPVVGRLAAIDSRGRCDLAVVASPTIGPGAAIFDRLGRIVAVQTESDPLQPNRAFGISIRRALESVGQGQRGRASVPPFESPQQTEETP